MFGDSNTPLSVIYLTVKQKNQSGYGRLDNTVHPIDLYIIFQTKEEYIIFSNA